MKDKTLKHIDSLPLSPIRIVRPAPGRSSIPLKKIQAAVKKVAKARKLKESNRM